MRVSTWTFQRLYGGLVSNGRASKGIFAPLGRVHGAFRPGKLLAFVVLTAMAAVLLDAQEATAVEGARAAARRSNLPPRVLQAERFLAQRGWTRGGTQPWAGAAHFRGRANAAAARAQIQIQAQTQAQTGATWQPLGPTAVASQKFGLVTGRVSALALDPSDTTGNTLYVGTTGGGVWRSQNVATGDAASVVFTPLTNNAFIGNSVALCTASGTVSGTAIDTSFSIGALTVQPGGTGVILAGTGDPNDALDSYYGAGILRSTDGGNTWSLIQAHGLEQGWASRTTALPGRALRALHGAR